MGTSHTTYELTADKQILTKSGFLCTVSIITNGTDDATVIMYDVDDVGDIAAGNKLFEGKVTGANGFGGKDWTYPVKFQKGLYMDIDGTGASAIIEWAR
jgi:hypothetical protein